MKKNLNELLTNKINELHDISYNLDISDPERIELDFKAKGIKIALEIIQEYMDMEEDLRFIQKIK
jgi:hypothetical protein